MKEKAPPAGPLLSAYEAALEEERRLWNAISDPEAKPTERVMAYARWRAAAKRLKELTITPYTRGGPSEK